MSVDMTKWQEIAKARIHDRPAGAGRLAGKIAIVTGGKLEGILEPDSSDVEFGLMMSGTRAETEGQMPGKGGAGNEP